MKRVVIDGSKVQLVRPGEEPQLLRVKKVAKSKPPKAKLGGGLRL